MLHNSFNDSYLSDPLPNFSVGYNFYECVCFVCGVITFSFFQTKPKPVLKSVLGHDVSFISVTLSGCSQHYSQHYYCIGALVTTHMAGPYIVSPLLMQIEISSIYCHLFFFWLFYGKKIENKKKGRKRYLQPVQNLFLPNFSLNYHVNQK